LYANDPELRVSGDRRRLEQSGSRGETATGSLAAPLGPFRSLLFGPGIRADLMQKGRASGADVRILDLEDSVPADRKAEARRLVAAELDVGEGAPAIVRVNHVATGEMEADVEAVVTRALGGIVLPKTETPDEVLRLDAALAAREEHAGLPVGSIPVFPLIESCLGLHHCYAIAAASPRVGGMVFSSGGEGDFMVDLQGRWTPAGEAFLYPRSKLVCETRAAGVDTPIDGVFMDLEDPEGLKRESELARNMGFVAKLAIHPKQVPVINQAFTPTEAEVEYSTGLVAAFREAEAAGRAAVAYRGTMVDYANVKLAERILALSRLWADSPRTE
jgi:citrate lyase subunit beta/citryl-CoA lyase